MEEGGVIPLSRTRINERRMHSTKLIINPFPDFPFGLVLSHSLGGCIAFIM
jgi:hypothetical protein